MKSCIKPKLQKFIVGTIYKRWGCVKVYDLRKMRIDSVCIQEYLLMLSILS